MNIQRQTQPAKRKSILQLTLGGALGFGISGATLGTLLFAFSGESEWFGVGGLAIMGAIGGTSLGLAVMLVLAPFLCFPLLASGVLFLLSWRKGREHSGATSD